MNMPKSFAQWLVAGLIVVLIAASIITNVTTPQSLPWIIGWVLVWASGITVAIGAISIAVRRPSLAQIEAEKTLKDTPASATTTDTGEVSQEIQQKAAYNQSKASYLSTVFSLLGLSAFYLFVSVMFASSKATASQDDTSALAIFLTLYALLTLVLTIIFIVQTVRRYKKTGGVWVKRMWWVFGAQAALIITMIVVLAR